MLRRRPVVVTLLVAALTSLALGAEVDMASDQPRGPVPGEAALTDPDTGLDPAVTRMNAEGRRDSVTSQRPLKQRLVILAVVASIASFGSIPRRRPVLRAPGRLPVVAWAANQGSRSPPQFQLLTP